MAEQPSGLTGAADRIREAAKWLTVALAAIGGVLVAGSQLSDIGTLEKDSERFWIAIGGAAAAGLGAAVIVIAAGFVLTTPARSLTSVATKPPAGTKRVLSDVALLGAFQNAKELEEAYLAAIKNRTAAFKKYLAAPDDSKLRTQVDVADAYATAIDDTVGTLMKAVSYEDLARRWLVAQYVIVLGALVGGTGVGFFAWAANPPEEASASTATPNVLTAPAPGELNLTQQGIENLHNALGSLCPTETDIKVLVLARTDAGPDILVDQAPQCQRIRFILGAEWGAVKN